MDGVHPPDELRAEDQDLHIRQLQTIFDLVGGIAEVHRYRDAPRLQDAEVHRQPLQAVHHEDAYLRPPLHAPAEEQVGEAVGPAVEVPPAQSPAVGRVRLGALNEAGFPPCNSLVPLFRRAQLHQCGLRPVEPGVPLQKIRNDHVVPPKPVY